MSIHQDTRLNLTSPITERLRQRDTGLRSTADASLLVESLLDLGLSHAILTHPRDVTYADAFSISVVDQALEVIEEYQSRILKLEQAVLLKPAMKHVRRRKSLQVQFLSAASHFVTVHILQGDLILHKRTLEPIKTVIYGLRRYDVDRVAALKEYHDPNEKIQGYMSHKAKIYLVSIGYTCPLSS